MAKGYGPVARDQQFLLPPDMREWLPADHPVWLVISAVADHLDTSAFHAARRLGGAGAAGFDPDMLGMLLAGAYADRVASSRRSEALCRTDGAFRGSCGGGGAPRGGGGRGRGGGGGGGGGGLWAGPPAAYRDELGGGRIPAGTPAAGAGGAAARAGRGGAEADQAARAAAGEARGGAGAAAGIRGGPGGRKPFPPDAHFQVARA